MLDLPSLSPVISKLLEEGVLTILLLYGLVKVYNKLMEVQDLRVKDSTEREKTITIALNTVVQNMENNNETLKAIKISLEHNNGKH